MIDWLSASFRYDGPPIATLTLRKEMGSDRFTPGPSSPHFVEGSYSAKMSVLCMGGRLYISGNPCKFLTGQNVYGSNDIHALLDRVFHAICRALDLPPCLAAQRAITQGHVKLSRVDCTFSYHVGSDDDCAAWLEAMGRACHVRFRGRGHFDSGMCSLMYGLQIKEGKKPKASRRSTFKFYNKFRELAVHRPRVPNALYEEIRAQSLGKVRGEAVFRGLELKTLNLDRSRKWDESTPLKLHRQWIDKMEIAENYSLKDAEELKLPRRLQAAYHFWSTGIDPRAMLSKPTFYRHRRDLLDHGIDIAGPAPVERKVVVMPTLRVIEAQPVDETETESRFWSLVA